MSFIFLEVLSSYLVLLHIFFLSSYVFRLIALRSFLFVCVKGEGCVWVCFGLHSLLPPRVLRRLELRLRPAWREQLPASVSLQSIEPLLHPFGSS